jgi:two-component sensor histidine kinase
MPQMYDDLEISLWRCEDRFPGNLIRVFSERVSRLQAVVQFRPSWGAAAVAALFVAAGALTFDALTPQIISVGIFYVGLVLLGFWFPKPKAALALALLGTILVIAGYWITIPESIPAWQAWLNRALTIGTVWFTAVFVWRIRILEEGLQRQTDITKALSREISHRVGNLLQLVSSFLMQQARGSGNEEVRRALERAGSRVVVIGNIQRLLSHSTPSRMIDSKDFIMKVLDEVRSTLPNSDQVDLAAQVDSVELTSLRAIALGTLLVELINNTLKYAFPEGMKGMLTVNFTVSGNKNIIEFTDDGVGIAHGHTPDGFGTRNVKDIAHLLGGSITCQAACQSDSRPGTTWRLVIPA